MFKLAFVLIVAAVSGAPVLGNHRALLAKKTTKAAPSVHAKVALDAKLSLLTEANAPNKRSKAMENKGQRALALENNHTKAISGASTKIEDSHAAYDALKKACVACKLGEDAVVSQLELVISLHDFADEKLDEYNSAKAAAEEASGMAKTLEGERDEACAGAPEADADEETTTSAELEEYSIYKANAYCVISNRKGEFITGLDEKKAACDQDPECVGFDNDESYGYGKLCTSLEPTAGQVGMIIFKKN